MAEQERRLHHIAIRTNDYEASKLFYTKGVGAECFAEWKHPKGFMCCMVEFNNGGIIEVLGSGQQGLPENYEELGGCYIHLAIEVENVEEAVAQAVRYGGKQKGEIKDNDMPYPLHLGSVFGPSGEQIEFLKRI